MKTLAGFILASIFAIAANIGVAEINWNNPAGGLFHNDAEWLGGLKPTTSEIAVFDLDSIYTVTFDADAETGELKVLDDEVTFDLGGFTYLLSRSVGTQVLINSDPLGASFSRMIFTNGTIELRGTVIGRDAGSNGLLRITGADAHWNNNLQVDRTIVGYFGDGEMEVLNGAQVTLSHDTQLALHPGSSGSLLISGIGTTYTTLGSQLCIIGAFGSANLEISQQAQCLMPTTAVRIATHSGGSATVLITDPGTLWEAGITQLGDEGPATLTVQLGAHVISDTHMTIAEQATGEGHLIITDPGTQFDAGKLWLQGNGSIHIQNDAVVTVSAGILGTLPLGAIGDILIEGANTDVTTSGGFSIQGAGTCSLTVRNGATVTVISGVSRVDKDSALITGLSTSWTSIDFGIAAQDNIAILNITDGAFVQSRDVIIGKGLNADGTVIVSDGATAWDMTRTLFVGEKNNNAATLTITNGASVSCNSAIIANGAGSTGLIELVGPGNSFSIADPLTIGADGQGELSYSNDDIITVGGLYTQSPSGTLSVTFDSFNDAPIVVTGIANLSGTLNLIIDPGFDPPLGTEYQLITAASVSGIFNVVNQGIHPSGKLFCLLYEPTRVRLAVVDQIPAGDVNFDFLVNVTDLLALLSAWGPCPGCNEDITGDGAVNVTDLLVLLASWGSPCP